MCYFIRTLSLQWLFLRGTGSWAQWHCIMRGIRGDCHSSNHCCLVQGATCFFCLCCSLGGLVQVAAWLFQSSPTAISQPWHPTVTLNEWQDATFDCHVLYSAQPFSSWGCHQGSISTGIEVCLVCMCMDAFIVFLYLFYMCRLNKQHEFYFLQFSGQYATLHEVLFKETESDNVMKSFLQLQKLSPKINY